MSIPALPKIYGLLAEFHSPDALLGFMIEAHSVLPAIYRTKLAAKEEETAAAHSKYVDLLRDQRMCREAMRMFEGRIGEIRSNPAEVTDTWRRLRDHPLIERFYVIESAIHVETKAILCEHEGGAENTGSVVIRFPLNGSFTVWGLKPTHPKGIAHPHINPHGGACFGNVETAIQSAALDGRIADGFDLVLRWLVEGYDPTLAQSKIEEWIPKGAV